MSTNTGEVTFSAKDVMDLRNKTGLGMMDCKEALMANGGDKGKAEEWLRAKLKGKMDTRTERVTAEGRIAVSVQGSKAVIVEVRTETDFTAREPSFQKMVSDVAQIALSQPAGAVKPSADIVKRVDDVRITTGENMSFARGERLDGDAFGTYTHHDGKRAALIQYTGTMDAELATGICQHIVAHVPAPSAVSQADVPADTLNKIRAEGLAEAKASGKNDEIAAKIAEGKVRKHLEEITLLDQMYVKDPSGKTAVKNALPKGVTIKKFVRYTLGGE